MAVKKQRRVKHLNEVPAKVHLKAGKLRVIVEIPWADLERRLGAELKAEKKFRKKRKSRAVKQ
jgi:hypothetical protein